MLFLIVIEQFPCPSLICSLSANLVPSCLTWFIRPERGGVYVNLSTMDEGSVVKFSLPFG